MEYNVYCDESCHLENDNINVMTLGGIYCHKNEIKQIAKDIREIKAKNNISQFTELKWTKISPSGKNVYADLINYFFDNKELHFRCIIVPNKKSLDHDRFNQTHDDWYYKMYFAMLKTIFDNTSSYNIYIDIKDTHSTKKSKKLHEVLANSQYDFDMKIIKKIQPIRSHESEIMQIVDVLIGACAYANRVFSTEHMKSEAKEEIVNLIKERSGFSMQKSTLLKEDKFNLFVWESR